MISTPTTLGAARTVEKPCGRNEECQEEGVAVGPAESDIPQTTRHPRPAACRQPHATGCHACQVCYGTFIFRSLLHLFQSLKIPILIHEVHVLIAFIEN